MEPAKKFAILRIVFGFVWAIDAFFKWQPTFFTSFANYLSSGAEGQPLLVKDWISLWISIVGVNPNLFAFVVAFSETAIAIGLILGLFTRLACYGGMALAFAIWSTAEGFGGPYVAGSTDIGAALIYVIVFAALLLGQSQKAWSIDAALSKKAV